MLTEGRAFHTALAGGGGDARGCRGRARSCASAPGRRLKKWFRWVAVDLPGRAALCAANAAVPVWESRRRAPGRHGGTRAALDPKSGSRRCRRWPVWPSIREKPNRSRPPATTRSIPRSNLPYPRESTQPHAGRGSSPRRDRPTSHTEGRPEPTKGRANARIPAGRAAPSPAVEIRRRTRG